MRYGVVPPHAVYFTAESYIVTTLCQLHNFPPSRANDCRFSPLKVTCACNPFDLQLFDRTIQFHSLQPNSLSNQMVVFLSLETFSSIRSEQLSAQLFPWHFPTTSCLSLPYLPYLPMSEHLLPITQIFFLFFLSFFTSF